MVVKNITYTDLYTATFEWSHVAKRAAFFFQRIIDYYEYINRLLNALMNIFLFKM